MVKLKDLLNYLEKLLDTAAYSDYCPNGLQVEGKSDITVLVSGVSASLALVDAAIDAGADVILVHHGYFWKGEQPSITGIKRKRIQRLLQSDINLLAYHLPLDAHAVYGNNAQLASILNLTKQGSFGTGSGPAIGVFGRLNISQSGQEFASFIHAQLKREPLYIAGQSKKIQTIAWCTGAAQSYIEEAVLLGVDAFLTGEVSEQTVHIARETGLHFFAAGHHATERYGARALGAHLAEQFNITHRFIDIENPV